MAAREYRHTHGAGGGGRPENGAKAAALAVVGGVVAQAMALQEVAGPGVILCSEATARLVRRLVRFDAKVPETPPSLPTPVYQLLGLHSRPVPIGRRGGGPLSPFVGHGHALTTLQALLRQAEAGQGRLVGSVGEPGLGKSRLLFEFRHRLRQR